MSESMTESSTAAGLQQPKFVRTLKDGSAVVGKPAQFKCIVTGMPIPEVRWYVDGDAIQHSREYDIVYEDGVCILRINEVLPEDEGEYSCEASNTVGKAETKCFLKVLDKCKSQNKTFSGGTTIHIILILTLIPGMIPLPLPFPPE
ncbi:unnamed protein product [Cylicostephanus goldi]|uniref:Ig-like domain-containing protein n=1 Tax=Cylicostephanus goldi TaxID=71465 RepID=A0A3P6SP10_CYLGO|nr:unnamed protein product [Cylicostephanus goldi]